MELHLTKKDFKVSWFSGTGAGGQHRNKHQKCCRITHIETGISAVGQNSRSRESNQAQAFRVLAKRIVSYYASLEDDKPAISNERIRTYNKSRNEVMDHASGLKQSYDYVVTKGNLNDMIEARRMVCALNE